MPDVKKNRPRKKNISFTVQCCLVFFLCISLLIMASVSLQLFIWPSDVGPAAGKYDDLLPVMYYIQYVHNR